MQPNGARLYVGNNGSNVISVLNPATNTVVAEFTVVTSPNCCLFSPDSTTLYVNEDGTNQVTEIATATNTVTATFTVGTGQLEDAAFTPDGTQVYVSNTDTDKVSVVNRTTRLVVATIAVGDKPEGVAIIPSVSYGAGIATANLKVGPGRTVIVIEEQFPSNVYPWHSALDLGGGELVTVPRPLEGSWTEPLLETIDERTAVVTVPHCHWTDGYSKLSGAAVTYR